MLFFTYGFFTLLFYLTDTFKKQLKIVRGFSDSEMLPVFLLAIWQGHSLGASFSWCCIMVSLPYLVVKTGLSHSLEFWTILLSTITIAAFLQAFFIKLKMEKMKTRFSN
jgi:hypothetical protein